MARLHTLVLADDQLWWHLQSGRAIAGHRLPLYGWSHTGRDALVRLTEAYVTETQVSVGSRLIHEKCPRVCVTRMADYETQ